jgi:glycosyltransferase involved in cell wall biosynthesis
MTRIAYLTYSTAEYDGRTQRMARTALAEGYEVVVYARWQPGLPFEEQATGYTIKRVPALLELAIPGRRGRGRRRVAAARRRQAAEGAAQGVALAAGRDAATAEGDGSEGAADLPAGGGDGLGWIPDRLRGTAIASPLRAFRRIVINPFLLFPLRPRGWAVALDEVAEHADIWHGMWAGSLPALVRHRSRLGGRTIYDSRDVYMHSRGFERMGPFKAPFAWLERRWARRVDTVLTVNDAYADLLARRFDIDRPPVVRNTPWRYEPPSPPPDLIRQALDIPPEVRVVLYQGGLLSDRGIEQGIAAIGSVPDAVFAIMGFGSSEPALRALARSVAHGDRVRFLPPVPPDRLLDWTASADAMLMAIQPTSINHRFTTPQKLWEAIAAGVPVVASDLPGMAEVVRETGGGALVDPTDPADIARGIRDIVDAPPDERQRMRERTWRAGQDRYNWEHESRTLLELYRALLASDERPRHT